MSCWTDKERGPTCKCGWPTIVWMIEGRPNLMCFGHTKAEGALFRLPSDRPDDWGTLTTEQLAGVIQRGEEEFPFESDEHP